jgi:hypothetical protein
MTEISVDDLRRLQRAQQKDAVLVLIEGRIEVIGAGQLASDDYRGALEIVSQEDLVKRLGEAPTEHEFAEQAAALGTAISELGA